MFHRLLIANRGECAARFIKCCIKLGIEPYLCMDAASLGAYPSDLAARCIVTGRGRDAFENRENLLQAMLQYDCQGVACGYGFLSEDSIFAQQCALYHRAFIGPQPKYLDLFGDKLRAKEAALAGGLATSPWTTARERFEELCVAENTDFPCVVKNKFGGGGKSVYLCETKAHFLELCSKLRSRGEQPRCYFRENYLPLSRHIECQLAGDSYGHVAVIGWRDCSIQIRQQKWIEESYDMPDCEQSALAALEQNLTRLFSSLRYRGLATAEFLCDPSGEFYFMEVNPRLQVEHGVTEMVTGIDLVEILLHVSAGEALPDLKKFRNDEFCSVQQSNATTGAAWHGGHAIECRLYAAESSDSPIGFEYPSEWDTIAAFPVRLERALNSGERVSPYYDGLVAKLIVWGESRKAAMALMLESLQKCHIHGVLTNKEWHIVRLNDLISAM